jgi:hypothetical protein
MNHEDAAEFGWGNLGGQLSFALRNVIREQSGSFKSSFKPFIMRAFDLLQTNVPRYDATLPYAPDGLYFRLTCDDNNPFPGNYGAVNVTMPRKHVSYGSVLYAGIFVNPNLRIDRRSEWKKWLAHEWLEVHIAFAHPQLWAHYKSIRHKGLRSSGHDRPTPWRDAHEFSELMQEAMKLLLIPTESFLEMVEGELFEDIRKDLKTDEKGMNLVKQIAELPGGLYKMAERFSKLEDVDREWVLERIVRMILEHNGTT